MAGAHLSRKYGPPPDPPGGAGGAGGPGGPDHWKKPKWAGYVRPYSAVEKGAIALVALAVVTYVSMSVTYSNRIGRMPWAWAGDDVPGFNAYAWERVVYVTELVWPTPPKKSGPAPGAVPFDPRLRPGAAATGGAPGAAAVEKKHPQSYERGLASKRLGFGHTERAMSNPDERASAAKDFNDAVKFFETAKAEAETPEHRADADLQIAECRKYLATLESN